MNKSDLVGKIKEDAEMKELPEKQLDCIADVYIKYGDKDQLNEVIDGKRGPNEEVKGLDLDNKKFASDMTACTEKK